MVDGDWAETPLINISGMLRTGKKHYLITENYLLSLFDYSSFLSFIGGRYNFGAISLDYGLILPWEEIANEGPADIPWISVSIPLCQK